MTLKHLLNDYKWFAGLSVHWVMVGPSGRVQRPAAGGVLRHYSSCNKAPNVSVKTIANSYYVSGIKNHPHTFEFRCAVPLVSRPYV